MLFIYTLPLNSSEGLKFIILYIKQNFGMSATRLCKSFIYFCIFKETVAVLYGNTYYETPCMSRVVRKPTFWFPTWSDTNQAVQPQKMARGLKFRIKKVEKLYYLCSENKGADQLRGYRKADLRLCFRICKSLVFSSRGSYIL